MSQASPVPTAKPTTRWRHTTSPSVSCGAVTALSAQARIGYTTPPSAVRILGR
jgi:hypothetical protein